VMSSTMKYKDYVAKVEYSSEDRCFFGKIEMIDDLVTFEATTVEALEKNFHNSVEEYIETCKTLGKSPERSYKGVFNVRVEPELHRAIYKEALKVGVSLNTFIAQVLAREVHGERVGC
jgi:predicted HicB family RNase H-like nuclease